MYFGPDLSCVASVRPVNAIIFPFSLAIGNMMRLRNLEYMADVARPPAGPGSPARAAFARSGVVAPSAPSFHENKPEARIISSLKSAFSRSLSVKPESGANPILNVRIVSSFSPRPARYSRA